MSIRRRAQLRAVPCHAVPRRRFGNERWNLAERPSESEGGHATQCAEVVSVLSRVIEKPAAWNAPACVVQLGLATAYAPDRHAAVATGMSRRHVRAFVAVAAA